MAAVLAHPCWQRPQCLKTAQLPRSGLMGMAIAVAIRLTMRVFDLLAVSETQEDAKESVRRRAEAASFQHHCCSNVSSPAAVSSRACHVPAWRYWSPRRLQRPGRSRPGAPRPSGILTAGAQPATATPTPFRGEHLGKTCRALLRHRVPSAHTTIMKCPLTDGISGVTGRVCLSLTSHHFKLTLCRSGILPRCS